MFYGSRSVGTERDPKEFRTSSEGDPKKWRLDTKQKTAESSVSYTEIGLQNSK